MSAGWLERSANHSWPRHRCPAQYRARHFAEAPAGSFFPGCSRGSRWLGCYTAGVTRKELVSCERIFTLGLDEVVDGDQDTDSDKAVGKIECRPMKVRPIEVEKINHFPVRDPIDEVPDRAAEDESECRDQAGFPVGQTSQHRNHKADR